MPVKYPGSSVVNVPYGSKSWAVKEPEYNPNPYTAPTPVGESSDPQLTTMFDIDWFIRHKFMLQ